MKNSGGEYMEFRYKVLVIDDDSSVSFYIKSVLEAQIGRASCRERV